MIDPPSEAETVEAARGEGPGGQIGPYKILQRIGEGGFGTVFEAEQEHPVKRRVALKVIKVGMDTERVIARFDAERQALALMEHPHIARVLDASATASGRPYFVMELVRGEPISSYCDRHRLSIVERLRLFEQVCAAVQHAHTKGVIHRDLKPSNVLVSSGDDGLPFAKVIDFGIAKATSGRLIDRTLFTELHQMMGTPLYMSPEQAEGSADIDTRTDIYSLGVVLYELLTGTTPFESAALRSAALAEVQRVIREVEPPRPSVRLSQSGATLADVAARRLMEPRTLTGRVRGDLDWIVMKAIEKSPARRYETANALAMDIRRHLAGEPVLAVPPSASYRLQKFVRRHKGGVAAGSLVAVALLVGIAAFAWQARIARARADELEQVSNFQSTMLEQVDPTEAGRLLSEDVRSRFEGALVKAGVAETERPGQVAAFDEQWRRVNATDAARDLIDRTILKPAVAAIDTQFKDQPVVATTLRQVLADRYHGMGLFAAALPLQQSALATRRRVLGEEHPDTLTSISSMGELLLDQGNLSEAEPYLRDALAKRRRVLGEEHPDTLLSINDMGGLRLTQGRPHEAEPYWREALATRRRVLGEEHPDTLNSLNNMGGLLYEQGQLSEAEPYWREVLAKRRRLLGEEHPSTLNTISNLGMLLQDQRKLSESELYRREALEKSRRVLGEEHPDTLININSLGRLLEEQGRPSEAEPYYREALEKSRRVLGQEHKDTLTSMINLGRLLQDRGRLSEAEPYLREALEAGRHGLGDKHPTTLISVHSMGSLLVAQHRNAAATKLLVPFEVATRDAFTGGNSWRLASFLMNLGKARTGLGEFAAAEGNLLEAQPLLLKTRGPQHKDTHACTQAVIDLYSAWHAAAPNKGYDAKAAEWKKGLNELGA